MFQLSQAEGQSLLLQNARPKGRGGRRTLPYAFTGQGVSMLSSVLNRERANEVNIAIMRAFKRAMLETPADLLVVSMNWSKDTTSNFEWVFEPIREITPSEHNSLEDDLTEDLEADVSAGIQLSLSP